MDMTGTSKFLSRILRHKPWCVGITLDEHGWADVDELLAGMQKTRPVTREILQTIVETDEKQRYAFSADGRLIRANQGHSVPVDVELPIKEPPEFLFHGTSERFVDSIDRQGLLPMSRLYVHLSPDVPTAVKVGSRHGRPFVYRVAAGQMQRDGLTFFQSVNGVWLTEHVPARYLQKESI